MSLADVDREAQEVGGERMQGDFPAVGRPVDAFGHPDCPGGRAWASWAGAWLLYVRPTTKQQATAERAGEPYPGHLIAVSVSGSGQLRRYFVDSGNRQPRAFSSMRSAIQSNIVCAVWMFPAAAAAGKD